MNGGLSFSDPLWLLLLPLALALALLAERGGRARLGRRRAVVRIVRIVVLALLVVALAGPQAWRREDRLAVIFAVDASRSVGVEGRERARRVLEEAAELLPDGDRAGVIVVGESAMVDSHPQEDWQAGELLARPGGEATDLAAAVRLARGLFHPGDEARLVLLTDGLETRGSIEDAVVGAGDEIDLVWFPLGQEQPTDVLIDSVHAPERVTEGEPHRIRISARASAETDAVLRVYRGGSLLSASRVHLKPGPGNLFSVEQEAPESSGNLLYRVEVEAVDDAIVENNRASAVVKVEGRPRVLILDVEPSTMRPLARVLERADMSVTVGRPGALPGDLVGLDAYDAIVLADAPATALSDGQLEALRTYVETAGGGLVMLGGPDSLGPGGYWQTPVEAALPVDMDIKDRRHYPSIGLVLAIDKSGSMAGSRTVQKIDVAKAAAAEVAAQLTEMDRIGVIAFDAAAKWVVPPTEGGLRDEVVAQLGTLRAGGGTDAYPAMELAHSTLVELNTRIKHVILLTDGQLAARDHEGLASRMAFDGISVTTVAIGSDADLYTLDRIAAVGNGEFYQAEQLARLPRIFLREAFRVSRAWLVEEPFQPVVQLDHTALSGLDLSRVPPLEGYVATTAKPAAQQVLLTPQGDPLLGIWRYGLGTSVAFTSDAKGRWGASWLKWQGYEPFWSQLVRWTARGDTGGGRLDVATQVVGEKLRVTADLFAADGSFVNGGRPRTVLAGPGGLRRELTLEQVGPGRYQAEIDAEEPGVYMAAVVDEDAAVGSTSTTVKAYSGEFATLDRSPDTLERLVASGHASITDDVETLFRRSGRGGIVRWPLAPWFLALAAALLVGEVAARKLRFGGRAAARAAIAATVATPGQAVPATAATGATAQAAGAAGSLGRLLGARDRARARLAREATGGDDDARSEEEAIADGDERRFG